MAVPAIFVTSITGKGRFASGKACASCICMNNITSFRDLLVWQKSMDLAVRCYKAAQRLPKADQMVLGYQIRKSAVSMPSNIAEGFSRHSTAFYIQHLGTTHASGAELETQIELGSRLDLIPSANAESSSRTRKKWAG